MNEAELRESVHEIGPLLPVIKISGLTVDGSKREKFALERGRTANVVDLDPVAGLRALWIVHPERALERLGRRDLDEYSRAFGCRALTVATYLQSKRVQTRTVDGEKFGTASALVQTWWSPKLKYLAQLSAKEKEMNLSEFVREAVATHIARTRPESVTELSITPQPHRDHRPRQPRTVVGSQNRPNK